MISFEFPVLESNQIYYAYFEFSAEASVNPNGSGTGVNITTYLFDSTMYLDNNDNIVKCGANDENSIDIGAKTYDIGFIDLEGDA